MMWSTLNFTWPEDRQPTAQQSTLTWNTAYTHSINSTISRLSVNLIFSTVWTFLCRLVVLRQHSTELSHVIKYVLRMNSSLLLGLFTKWNSGFAFPIFPLVLYFFPCCAQPPLRTYFPTAKMQTKTMSLAPASAEQTDLSSKSLHLQPLCPFSNSFLNVLQSGTKPFSHKLPPGSLCTLVRDARDSTGPSAAMHSTPRFLCQHRP